MNDFVGGIQARAEFYNLAKHSKDSLVNSLSNTDPVTGLLTNIKERMCLIYLLFQRSKIYLWILKNAN